MKQKWKILQLFAEGAEGDGGETGAQAAEAEVSEPAAPEAQAGTEERIRMLEQQLENLLHKPSGEPQVDETMVRQHWAGVDRIYEQLVSQADALKQLYPDFDLGAEMRDARFAGMLRSGVDMRSAFYALHGDEILPAAMQYAARTVEQRLAGAMRAGADRPGENGLHGSGAVRMGTNAAVLTRRDYDRICRMVERGERVSFG